MVNKTASITIRLTPEQKELVEGLAKQNSMTLTDFVKSALLEKTHDKRISTLNESETESRFVNINMTLTKDQEEKVIMIAEELGITKQQCIRRLINEGNIYDLRININMEEEFLTLTAEINEQNRILSGIYSICRRVDGVLTKHEVDHLYDVIHEIKETNGKMLGSIYATNAQLKNKAGRRMEKLIRDKLKEGG